MKYRYKNNEDLGWWAVEPVLRLMYEDYADTRLFGWPKSIRPMLQSQELESDTLRIPPHDSRRFRYMLTIRTSQKPIGKGEQNERNRDE